MSGTTVMRKLPVRLFHCHDQRELQPLEVAFHLVEAGPPEPFHLLIQPGEPIGRIVLGPTDLAAKALVEARRRRAHEIEIGENPAASEKAVDFPEQLLLASVLEMVDSKARDDSVYRPIERECQLKVVLAKADSRIAVEPLSCPIEHWHRGVEARSPGLGILATNQRQEAPVAGAQVDESIDLLGECLEQHFLGDRAVRDLSRKVLGNPATVRPLLRRHAANAIRGHEKLLSKERT